VFFFRVGKTLLGTSELIFNGCYLSRAAGKPIIQVG
jgi:hypothetical protein